ncbi:MAG: zinc-binding alcohol dehydrogenase, partial [Actinomycetota bacterium]|nr:zinc-binding alcohol dehydrogenase [Actinomycetota bacterium]
MDFERRADVVEAQAVLFVAPRRVEVRPVEVPEPADGEVLVATSHSGISAGTEMLAYRGDVDPDLPLDETIGSLGGTFSYPFPYGYSCAGWVDRPGGGLEEGAPVFAYHPHQSRFCVPAEEVVPVGRIPPRHATLFPLVETALQVTLDAGAVLGQTVVVMGLGAVGLLIGAILTRTGARVLGGEPLDWRRAAGSAFGVEAIAPDALPTAVAETTGGAGVPLVIEASGNPAALASSLPLLAHEGTALVASWYGTRRVTLPLGAEFHRRRLSIRSTQVSTIPAGLGDRWSVPRRRAATLDLLPELPLDRLATH